MTTKLGLTLVFAVALAGLTAHAAIAGSPEPTFSQQKKSDAMHRYQMTLIERLSNAEEPRRRMAAAILARVMSNIDAAGSEGSAADKYIRGDFFVADADELVRGALAQAPDDPLLLWIAATNCPVSNAVCDSATAAAQLRDLTPENAAVWLLPLPVAEQTKSHSETLSPPTDATTVSQDQLDDEALRLSAIASATRVHFFDLDIQRLLLDALSQAPIPQELLEFPDGSIQTADMVRAVMAAGFEMAFVALQWGQQMALCREEVVDRLGDTRRSACIEAMQILRGHAEDIVVEQLANSSLLKLLPDGPERELIETSQRNSNWQLLAYMELSAPADANDAEQVRSGAATHLALLHDDEATELNHLREHLLEAGIPLQAPADWQSPY